MPCQVVSASCSHRPTVVSVFLPVSPHLDLGGRVWIHASQACRRAGVQA
jgi:hypothetical protein